MSGSSYPITVVEAFTIGNKAFTGNPAAIVLLEFDDDLDDVTKQGLANTMNLSETAFVSKGWKRSEGVSESVDSDPSFIRRTLRWFTPNSEIKLCGHATVASTKALLSEDPSIRKIEFLSLYRGTLGVSISDDGELITLNFPSNPSTPIPLDSPWVQEFVRNVLGADTNDTLDCVKDVGFCENEKLLLITFTVNEGDSPLDFISNITPDFGAILTSTEYKTGGLDILIVTVTVQSESDGESKSEGDEQPRRDFYSRTFAPRFGINEDPVCGMAHTILTPYWTKELGQDGKSLRTRQASKRGGDLVCQLVNGENGNEDRISLGGRARVVLKGQLNV